MGNICRSPAAEGTFRHLLKQEGLEQRVQCDSAGTIDYHTGATADARMRGAARERGIQLTSIARQIAVEDLDTFDLILCMDEDNLEYVEHLAGESRHRARVRLFCEFVSDSDAREVPDPYYGGADGFDEVMDLLEDGCANLLEYVRRKIGLDAAAK
ncbi:low molecular weight phosphotyrosine protein phosphatase [bacterium]|nr:low molecular weight phosphotyrosine protein phosphatase [bacterium]